MNLNNLKNIVLRSIAKAFPYFSIAILIISAAFSGIIVFTIVAEGIPHLKEALHSEEVLFSLRTSLFTTSISTIICLLIAIPSAYALARTKFPFCRIISLIVELPLSLPNLVLGLSLLLIFSSNAGKLLRDMGFRVIFDIRGIIVAQVAVILPFVTKLIKTEFSSIDIRMEFIAGTLGASKCMQFLTISLPLSTNAIISAAILAWSRALGEFGAALMLVGVTRMKTETLPSSIYLGISTGSNETAMATAVILLTVSCCSFVATNLLNKKSLSRSEVR
ncbi:MAG TPA: nitrogen fixation protein NifC [Lachnospiraceae bacterium]|nr:nitrogen fixation protein NifC [Lachnospiraceae bacterium]